MPLHTSCSYCKSTIYTVNCGMAYGQAAMLLSLGAKGYRALQPNSSINRSSGAAVDMWIKAKNWMRILSIILSFLAKGTGKPKEELVKDIQRPKYLKAQEAIDYGIADKLLSSNDEAFEKRDYDALLAQTKAMKAQAAGPRAAPSGSR
ncbi:hypothetical protein NC652_023510 [Populus alba x Populus x berolinensis]|nr:hypothetical protein NC652_023510 [Populus alba x Populus x berolinensis]